MADSTTGTATQTTSNTGGSNTGMWRDINASLGAFDLLNNLGASTSSAVSGTVTIGDRIIGGGSSSTQFGVVKILALVAGTAILIKLYQDGGAK